ncbi:MAG: MBL fold metallo-hydrolase [Balneolaceae bacterium]
MNFAVFTVGPFAENTYLVSGKEQAVIIDPGFSNESEFSRFRNLVESSGLIPNSVLLTHAHVDHLLGLSRLLKEWSIPVYLSHKDLYLWENVSGQGALFGMEASGFSFLPEPLPETDSFRLGAFEMNLLYTPGHSPDHTSIYFKQEGVVVAGDTLFKESIGRTDLYKGDFATLERSIREKLYTLPDETRILPGHGPETTVGYEKKRNAFVKG